jgi:hypothetical protein
MRPKKPQTTGDRDLSRARIDLIINMKHSATCQQGNKSTGLTWSVRGPLGYPFIKRSSIDEALYGAQPV